VVQTKPVPESVLTAAFLLRSHPYGDSDRIVTFITEEFGKVSGIAKGAKRSQRRFAGTLEPFVKVRLAFRDRPRSDLAFIDRCELLEALRRFGSDLDRFASGSYVLELTDRVVWGRETGREVFGLVDAALSLLESEGARAAVLRGFELHILEAAGYRPELERCRGCGREAMGLPSVVAVPSRGGVFCTACRPATEAGYVVPRSLLGALLDLQRRPLRARAAAAAMNEANLAGAEAVLEAFVNQVVSRPLRSPGVLAALRQPSPMT
jgi:DNA repair protein RecO (recombination protein O)